MLDSLEIISKQQLLDWPAADTIVVTVNNRMAIHLKKELIAAKRSDAKVFELTQVQPWTHFLEFLHERLVFTLGELPAAKQLSHFAALLYWEAVLEEQKLNTLNLTKLAKSLADAHVLQVEWDIEIEELEETPEYIEYKNIKTQYLQRLQRRGAIDGPLRNQWLVDQLRQGAANYQAATSNESLAASVSFQLHKKFAKKIVLLGFRELSAIQSGLLTACKDLGAELYVLNSGQDTASELQVIRTQSRSEELEAAVNWAKQMLEKHPRGRFAIVDPLLQTELNTVRRYLHERIQDGGLKTDLLYNVAIGRPLSDWTIVRSALAWLKLFIKLTNSQRISTQDLGESLLLGQEALVSTCSNQLNRLDLKLRDSRKVSYNKKQVQQFLHEISDEFSVSNQEAFELFSDAKYLRLNQWLQKFKAFFEIFTFPGLKKLSSVQYQVCTAFEQALKTVASLSPVLDQMTAADAFYLLDRVCKQQIFQPQRAVTARLDVLGILEAEGAKWDAVWILSMQDDVLPTVPKPNPLLPKAALLRVDAPRSDHRREFLWAEAMLKSLLETAPDIKISWHAFAGEMPTKASPLITQYLAAEQWSTLDDLPELNQTELERDTKAELEFLRDNYGPPVPTDGLLSGGSRLINLQAINPQWAFAAYRLHMREFASYPRYELDSLQRGNFIHASLEGFWNEVRDQASLKAMDDMALKEKISEVVDASARSELLFDSAALLALEKEFARNQLFHFLKLEQQRELSFTVAEVEKKVEITLSKIKLGVKIDRIDFLENDSYLYLDYKTGNLPSYKKNWYRERPIDLQLPLYAAYGKHPINDIGGVGFGGLKPREMGFAGIGSVNWSLPGKAAVETKFAADFEQQLFNWKSTLMSLADEIASGYAANSYVNQKDMQYCDVLPFLRLEQVFEEEVGEDD